MHLVDALPALRRGVIRGLATVCLVWPQTQAGAGHGGQEGKGLELVSGHPEHCGKMRGPVGCTKLSWAGLTGRGWL